MKLLVITMLYEPDHVGIAPIATDMCQGLAARGHEITVYTTYPYYPEWKLKSDVNPWRIQQQIESDVQVRRHGLFIPRHPSRLLPRLVHELSFPLSLLRSLFDRQQFDAVMVFCPLLGSVAFAALRKLFHRELLWVNVQDIPAEAGRATGINRSRSFHFLGSFAQKRLLRRGEIWSSLSPGMLARLEPMKSTNTILHLCPNWLVGVLADEVQRMPAKVGRPPRRPAHFLYAGTIGKKQGLLPLCQRFRQFDFDFRFLIRGSGGEAERVQSWVEGCGDSRFDFGALLSEREFVRATHDADWFVISETQGAGSSFLPSKLIPCISVGTPVVTIADHDGSLGQEVREHQLGIALEWSQLDQLPGRLGAVTNDPDQFTRLQQNCLARADDFHRDRAVSRMEDLLQDALARHPKGRRTIRAAVPLESAPRDASG